MNCDKRVINALFIVIIFATFEALVYASDDLLPSIPGNDYVLRSCMSSVELTRRNSGKSKAYTSLHNARRRTDIIPVMQSRYPVKSLETKDRKAQQKLEERMLRRGRPGRQMITDTPLSTLKVQRRDRKNVPQLYVKKNLLPEIESLVADGRKDRKNEASIVVIESAARLSH